MKRGMRPGIGGDAELPCPLQGEGIALLHIMFIHQETLPSISIQRSTQSLVPFPSWRSVAQSQPSNQMVGLFW